MTIINVERESHTTDARLMVPTVQMRDNRQVVAGSNQPLITRYDNIQSVIDGITFYAFAVAPTASMLAPLASLDILVTTAVGRPVGVGLRAECGGNAEIYVYEGCTDVVGGTIFVPLNRNRASTNTAVTGVLMQPTSLTLGDLVFGDLVLGGTGGNSAGATADSDYAILKADTSYLFRLTNVTAKSHVAALAVQWIENG